MKSEKSLHIAEIIITILQGMILATSIVVQIDVPFRDGLKQFLQDEFMITVSGVDESIAGIFLQVDATILTLTIALVAIMSGLLSESHMGISFSYYYLNVRPWLYKQFVIIILSLVYFGVSCISLWLDAFYIVMALLLCEILLVLMSVFTIYGIFGGSDKIRKEIRDYLVSKQVSKESRKKNDVRDKYIKAFCRVLSAGDKEEYDEYFEVLSEVSKYIWENRNKSNTTYTLAEFEKNCITLLDAAAESEKYDAKLLYIKFLDDIYARIETYIKNENGAEYHSSEKENTFNVVLPYSFGYEVLRHIDVKDFENTITVSDLMFRILLVEEVLHNDYKPSREGYYGWAHPSTVCDIQSWFGIYLSEQRKKGNQPNISYWGREFNNWHGLTRPYNLEDESRQRLENAIAYSGICYTCGLLVNGVFDIVKRGLFEERMDSLWDFEYHEMKIIMSVCSYLYYMSCREDAEKNTKALISEAKRFITDEDVMSSFRRFLAQNECADILIDNIRSEWTYDDEAKRVYDVKSREINTILRRFDLRMGRRDFHIVILPNVIDDFCLFTLFYLYIHGMVDLNWIGDKYHSIENFIPYISDDGRNQINGYDENPLEFKVKEYMHFINADIIVRESGNTDDVKKIDSKASRIYETIQNEIKTRYKEERIKSAREKESEFLKKHDEVQSKKNEWKKEIVQRIKDSFGSNIEFIPQNDIDYFEVELFSFSTYTDMIDDRVDGTDLGRITTRLIDSYIHMLVQRKAIELKDKKSDFSDDRLYINYLNSESLNVLVGSELLLKNSDYRNTEMFEEATRDYTWIKSLGGYYGAAIKNGSVVFCLRDLDVVLREATLDDIKYDSEDEGGYYEYAPISGVKLDFEEKELKEFIKQERKIIEVTAKIGVKLYTSNVGIYFVNPRNPVFY